MRDMTFVLHSIILWKVRTKPREGERAATCETWDNIKNENCDATRLRPHWRIISNLAEGGKGESFRAQAGVQKGPGKALGSVIAEGDFRRAFPGSFKRRVVWTGYTNTYTFLYSYTLSVKQKSLQRPPTIRFTVF